SKAPVQDGKEDTVTAVAPEDIYLIEQIGNQSSQSVQFTPDSKAIPAPLEAGTVVGHLTYEDKDLIGQGYITTERPSFEMVADKKIEKAFFLKVWWNQFVRFVNEKL
ncbi:D-alanyl-D-alanine carboxypeptidase, partial [Streptococcus pneumoniae]